MHLKRGSFDGDHFISCTGTLGGGFGVFTDMMNDQEYFSGFEFRGSVLFWVVK